jgi:hypothetical protein
MAEVVSSQSHIPLTSLFPVSKSLTPGLVLVQYEGPQQKKGGGGGKKKGKRR